MKPFDSWKEMTNVISTMSEAELREAIITEVQSYNRPTLVLRMHQRFTKVRAKREREAMLAGIPAL
jgi:hypothetical protein